MARKRAGTISKLWLSFPVVARIALAASVGVVAAILTRPYGALYSVLFFWDTTALIVSAGLWLSVRRLTPEETERHATKDDPARGVADIVMLGAGLASLAAVAMLVVKASNAEGFMQTIDIALGVVSVVISWTLVHLIYMLHYADLYFKGDGAIDFNSNEKPTYQDFAYVAFTIGMTYQVSDTSLKTSELRTAARQHALLSYVFGAAIIATVVNTIASLGK